MIRYIVARFRWATKTADLLLKGRIEPPCGCEHEVCCFLHKCQRPDCCQTCRCLDCSHSGCGNRLTDGGINGLCYTCAHGSCQR